MPKHKSIQQLQSVVLRTALLILALTASSANAAQSALLARPASDAAVHQPPLEAMPTLDLGASPSDLPAEPQRSKSSAAVDSNTANHDAAQEGNESVESVDGTIASETDLPRTSENELWQINTRQLPACCSNPTPCCDPPGHTGPCSASLTASNLGVYRLNWANLHKRN